jgi:hypothetical protein
MYGAETGYAERGVGHIHGFPGYEAAENALRNTLEHHPDHLDAYVDLCKLFFYSKRFSEAEQTARAALIESARQGRFDPDWRTLVPADEQWRDSSAPHRIYLYMLKALAFIRMRQLDVKGGQAVLDHLARLDPDDLVGGSVVRDLAGAMSDEEAL